LRIGIDVDSGERPFYELVSGALESLEKYKDISIYFIGRSDRIREYFPQIENSDKIFLVDAKEIVYMDESPVIALKKKRDATVFIGCRMIKDGSLDFFFSPGNTGATVASSILTLGMINHIKRPALATFFPRLTEYETMLLDIGANPEATEENLYQNAILGLAYYTIIWDKESPTIGLLNIGSEYSKGDKNVKKAFDLLKNNPFFIGNVEGYNIFNGSVDIVVCDGFTGNSMLKFAEAMKDYFLSVLKDSFLSTEKIKNKFLSYALNIFGFIDEQKKNLYDKILPRFYGAAPVLGVKGGVLVGHGMCGSKDIKNAIDLAYFLYEKKYLQQMNNLVNILFKK